MQKTPLGITPAMEAGIADHAWSLEEIIAIRALHAE
jgi:hypothetical protein